MVSTTLPTPRTLGLGLGERFWVRLFRAQDVGKAGRGKQSECHNVEKCRQPKYRLTRGLPRAIIEAVTFIKAMII